MDNSLLKNIGSNLVWRGGHGGLTLEVYEGGVVAVGNGNGGLFVALKATNLPSKHDFVAMVDSLRGYCCNNPESRMLHDAFEAALRS